MDAAIGEALQLVVSRLSPVQLGLSLGSMLVGGLFAGAVMVPATRRRVLPPAEGDRLADHLPFDTVLEDGVTLRLRDGSLARTVELAGRDVGSLGYGERVALYQRRKAWLEEMAGSDIDIDVFSRRSRLPLMLEVETDQPIRQALLDRHNAGFHDSYVTRYVLALTARGGTDRARKRLDEAGEAVFRGLADYRPRLLDNGPDATGASPLLSWWGHLAGGRLDPIGPATEALAELLYAGPVTVDTDSGLLTYHGLHPVYAYLYGIRLLPGLSSEEIESDLLAIQGELLYHRMLQVRSEGEAEWGVRRIEQMARAAEDTTSDVAEQLDTARSMLRQGARLRQALVDVQPAVIAFGRSPEEARSVADQVEQVLRTHNIRPQLKLDLALAYWWQQFPTFAVAEAVRPCVLFSQNVAELTNFEREPEGLPDSDWGPGPVLMLRTAAGAPTPFQFHDSMDPAALGHTLVVGPSGQGKTTLMQLLATGAMRHPKLLTAWFDRYDGAYVWGTACGGRYYRLRASAEAGSGAAELAPFQLPLDGPAGDENHEHLRQLLELMTGLADAESQELFGQLLDGAADLPPEQRSLEALVAASLPAGTAARREMERFVDPKQRGALFGGRDRFGLEDRLMLFDMTTVLQDATVAGPVVFHLAHRISAAMRERNAPALLVVDESTPMLMHDGFRARSLTWLREFRKRHAVLVLMFQEPDALDGIDPVYAGMVRQETATWILFRNPGAEAKHYAAWGLNDRELAFVLGEYLPHLPRAVLIKQPHRKRSGFYDIENRLGELAHLLRSDADLARQAAQMQATYGDAWHGPYIDWAAARAGPRGPGRGVGTPPGLARQARP